MREQHDTYQTTYDHWHTSKQEPSAFVRSMYDYISPAIDKYIDQEKLSRAKVLDLSCGPGYLANHLALQGHKVTAMDSNTHFVKMAKRFDRSKSVNYLLQKEKRLTFPKNTFDIVCASNLSVLLENPKKSLDDQLIQVTKVLKSDGLFIFHSFDYRMFHLALWHNRNLLAAPHSITQQLMSKNFVNAQDLKSALPDHGLNLEEINGLKPKVFQKPILKAITQGRFDDDFIFEFSLSKRFSYLGKARKVVN